MKTFEIGTRFWVDTNKRSMLQSFTSVHHIVPGYMWLKDYFLSDIPRQRNPLEKFPIIQTKRLDAIRKDQCDTKKLLPYSSPCVSH